MLTSLKRTQGLGFAFMFYDVLRVLPDDDPRLADPSTGDIPQTDFIVREASRVLSISDFSSADLKRHCARRGVRGPAIQTIRLAGLLPQAGPGRPVPGLMTGAFALSVGDVVARKNHALLVRVWRALDEKRLGMMPLVIVGRIDPEGYELVRTVKADQQLGANIQFMANADDHELRWHYENCRFTVFPSFLEGFGLPVAESLACGKPCIASSAASIPKAGQGAAISLDPHDDEAWGPSRRASLG